MTEPALVLYVKAGCHLCEDAADLLHHLGLGFEAVDITTDPTLAARYGLRVPVLARGGHDLGWPFGPTDIAALIDGRIEDSL